MAEISELILQALQRSSTATLTTALRKHGLERTFMHRVAPLRPHMKMAGPAHTLRYLPMREDLLMEPVDNLKDCTASRHRIGNGGRDFRHRCAG